MGLAPALIFVAATLAQTPRADAPTPRPDAQAPSKEPAALRDPPARAPIAGLRGFESRSRLVYPGQSGRAHELRATYVFPDRARWAITAPNPDARTEERRLRYRYGEHVLSVEPRQAASLEFRAEDRDALIAAFELRQAVFLWPDGHAWTGAGETRRAQLANGDTLTARVQGEPARPVSVEYGSARSEARDSFRAITWRTDGPRAWPAAFEVWSGPTLSWRETVEAVDTTTRYFDAFFVPPDRRGVTGAPVDDVRALDIPPVCLRRTELAVGTTWEAARAERARLVEAWVRAGGALVEDVHTYEVRADGRPAAVLVRLLGVPAEPPEGFVVLPERVGAATSLARLAAVDAAALARLAARLPAGAKPGAAYVRFDGQAAAPAIVLVLPAE